MSIREDILDFMMGQLAPTAQVASDRHGRLVDAFAGYLCECISCCKIDNNDRIYSSDECFYDD
jgi:hypothetical protein